MKKNQIILAILAMSLLLGQPMVAQEQFKPEQPKPERVSRLKKEMREFNEALRCVRQKGFRGCTRAQKKRIIAAGIVLTTIVFAGAYGVKRGMNWRQIKLERERQEQKRRERAVKESREWELAETKRQLAEIDTELGEGASLEQKLSQAVDMSRRYAVQELIRAGARLNAQDFLGRTPLHRALPGPIEIVQLLINADANLEAKNIAGETPLEEAQRLRKEYERWGLFTSNLKSVEKLLQQAMEARRK